MKSMALIPARFSATRFSGKLMKQLGNKTVILHTYQNTINTGLFDEVAVVTDNSAIYDEIKSHGGMALMSTGQFETGSDRIASVAKTFETNVIINVQGDEPFVKKDSLHNLLSAFEGTQVQVASLMCPIFSEADIRNPNYVKVVTDKHKNALYFSRSPIPFFRSQSGLPVMKHIGIYGYRKEALLSFCNLEKGTLESTEMLEQLRYLENGIPIRMVETDETPFSIDTPGDLEKAQRFLAENSTSN